MSWSIFPSSIKKNFSQKEEIENPKEEFNKLYELLNSINDETIIRGRSKKLIINYESKNFRCLYTRSGNPIRQFFQRILYWTDGAKKNRIVAKEIISGVIDKLDLENIEAKNIRYRINKIVSSEKDFDTKELKLKINALKFLLDKESGAVQQESGATKNFFQFPGASANENFDESSSIKYDELVTPIKINDYKNKINVIKTKEQSENTDSPQEKNHLPDEQDSFKNSQENSEILAEKPDSTHAPSHVVKMSESIAKSSATPPEKRFGGLLVIDDKAEPVTARRSLNSIFADAYLFPGNTPEPSFENAGPIEKNTELNNKKIGKFEQLINYEKRSFLKIQLKSPLKVTDGLVTTLNNKNQADYLQALKDIYRENFKCLVKEFAEDKKPLESIALVPISQGHLLVDIEVQALASAVHEFKKEYPKVMIQVVTDAVGKKAKIEKALKDAAV